MKNLLLLVLLLASVGGYSQEIETKKKPLFPPIITNLNCVNTDLCNLVSNPHMDHMNNPCYSEYSYGCIYLFTAGCNGSMSAIDCWTSMFNSYYWFDAFTTCTPNTNSFYNSNELPGDPGGSIAVRNLYGHSTDPNDHSGAFRTSVDVSANTNYILSFFRTNLSNGSWYASPGYDVALTDESEITWPATTTNVPPLISNLNIIGEDTIIGSHWEQMVTCFTTDNNTNYDVLYFESKKGMPNTVKGAKFDHVELVVDNLPNTPQSYTVACSTPTEIGIELCQITNMTYQWWDVSSNALPTQLTDGNSVVVTALIPYSVSTVNSTGSIIELTNITNDVDLELRRVVPNIGQDNIPINGTCNATASVNIISDCPQTSDCDPDNWPHGYGSTSAFNTSEVANSLAVNQSGEVYVKGIVDSSVSFEDGTLISGSSFLAKYDNCGNLLWVNDVSAFGDGQTQRAEIKVDNAGNIVMLSGFGNSATQDVEHRLTKFDGNGNVLWSNVIEQWRTLPRTSFDIDQSTNDIYLIASVGKYLRIKDQTNTYIVNYNMPLSNIFPRNGSYIVKFNPAGFQLWQDVLVSNGGIGYFEDVVVAEDLGQVYIMGVTVNYSFSNCNIHLNSNPGNNIVPIQNNRAFIANYSTNGVNNFFQLEPTLLCYANSNDIEFSNTDSELYLRSYKKKLTVFDQVGVILQSTILAPACNSLSFNQTDNYLLISGHTGNGNYNPHITKYHRTNQIWSYTIGSGSRGIIYNGQPDPSSNRIFIGGSFFDNPLTFSPSVSLPFAGGRDAFISRVRDQGPSVNYLIINSESAFESVDDNQHLSDVMIYPNPAHDMVTVRFSNPSAYKDKVELVDVMGHQIEQRVNIDEHSTLEFNLQALPSGIYFFKFYDLDGTVEVQKIIKQN